HPFLSQKNSHSPVLQGQWSVIPQTYKNRTTNRSLALIYRLGMTVHLLPTLLPKCTESESN
ncbi:MAG: hypothetical protein MK295_11310, partial [Pseudomonadales bacterium]|nr:hypothetical protein [Pseudomonadales bacterium]